MLICNRCYNRYKDFLKPFATYSSKNSTGWFRCWMCKKKNQDIYYDVEGKKEGIRLTRFDLEKHYFIRKWEWLKN